jgi:IS30 family transposase
MRSYSHLSEDERDQIGVLRAAGRSMGAIARALDRAKTTISRELQRNALPDLLGRPSFGEPITHEQT